MIKTLAAVLVILAFGLMAIGSGSSEQAKETKALVAAEEKSEDETKATAEAETTAEAKETEPENDVTIEEQVLFEADGVTVTAKEYSVDKIWGEGVKLLIENNGTSDIGVGCNALIVNDYMITDLFSETVAAGKKANSTLNLSTKGLQAAGIDNVGQIEVYFYTFDASTYSRKTELDCVTIKTSAFDQMEVQKADDGKELYNEDGIRIVGKYVNEDSFWGAGILLFIENDTDKNVIVQADDLSVNGFMMTPLFSSTVYSKKMALSEITLLSSEMEENGIESVDEVELKFHLVEADTYKTIKDTDPISFSAK